MCSAKDEDPIRALRYIKDHTAGDWAKTQVVEQVCIAGVDDVQKTLADTFYQLVAAILEEDGVIPPQAR
jgi:hypothetical protein